MKLSTTITAAALAIVVWACTPLSAQQAGIVGRFPDVARVQMDYPDDAERYIALDALFIRLGEVTRGTGSRGAYDLSSAYLGARNEVQAKYDQQGRDSQAYTTFVTNSGRLFTDPAFKRSVFERYGLVDLPQPGTATSEGPGGFVLFPDRPGDRSDEEIKAAFFEAFPVWAATVVGMMGIAWILMRSAGEKTMETPPQPDSPFGLPPFPESLRRVSVGGRRYDVALASGQVLDSGSAPGSGLVRVRTPDQHETSLALGGPFNARPGQIISVVGRPLPDGNGDALIAYNHTTDQLELLSGLYRVHATRYLLPCFLVALAGSIPGAFGLGMLFHRLGGLSASLPIALATLWIMAGFVSTIVAAFICVRMKIRVEAGRTRRFVSEYIGDYRGFFQESSAPLARHFAGM